MVLQKFHWTDPNAFADDEYDIEWWDGGRSSINIALS